MTRRRWFTSCNYASYRIFSLSKIFSFFGLFFLDFFSHRKRAPERWKSGELIGPCLRAFPTFKKSTVFLEFHEKKTKNWKAPLLVWKLVQRASFRSAKKVFQRDSLTINGARQRIFFLWTFTEFCFSLQIRLFYSATHSVDTISKLIILIWLRFIVLQRWL